MLIDAEGRNYT